DRFALYAAREALQQAGLPLPLRGAQAGVYFASSTGGMIEGEWFLESLNGPGTARPRRSLLASQPLSSPGEAVARDLGVTGPVQTISSACASGGLALEAAL